MKELVEKLNEASDAYYNTGEEIMSNYEYDSLFDELVELEKKTGVILPNSPTQRVGANVNSSSKLKKVKHKTPALSLDKTKSIDNLSNWLGDKIGILSWKMDGITGVANYKNGKLISLVTRGNGYIGEDITHNAKFIDGLPLTIPFKGEIEVRGELVMSYLEFDRINNLLEEKYKNPRNLTSGTLRALDDSIKNRKITFAAFQLVSSVDYEYTDKHANKLVDSIKFLKNFNARLDYLRDVFNFNVVKHVVVNQNTLADAVKTFEAAINTQEFPTDGLVLEYNDVAYGESLGATGHHPKYGLAFKWKDETVETILRDVEWSPSRTGLLNPVAIFDTVEIEGTDVSRASVHNVSIVKSLALGIGDKINVFKANMIIPQIANNLTMSGTLEIPKHCPCCGGATKIIVTEKESGNVEVLTCPNQNCSAKHIGAFEQFVSRNAMNIIGLSTATIEKLVDKGIIKDFSDFYTLDKDDVYQISKWDGMGEKSYANLISSIESSKNVDMDKFLFALGVPNIGASTATLICKAFDYNWETIMSANYENLISIDGIGEVIAKEYVEYFNNANNINVINKLLSYITFNIPQNFSNKLNGMTFVITGTLPSLSRNEASDLIEKNGGKVSSSVSKKTNYLLAGEAAGSKLEKAKTLGVSIISQDDLLKMI